MKLKRSQLTTAFVLIALIAITAATQLLSAYGAICVTWNDVRLYGDASTRSVFYPGPAYPYVIDNLLLFRLSNIVTWIGAFFWGYIIFALLTQKKGVYLMALITSAVSFAMGLAPALISDLAKAEAGGTEFAIGSPHWARVFANFLVLIVLVIPPVKKSVDNFVASDLNIGGVAQQLMIMSIFFFWLSLVSFLGTSFMASAHTVTGVNLMEVVQVQSIGALATLGFGVSMLSGGFILKHFNPSKALITTVEVNK